MHILRQLLDDFDAPAFALLALQNITTNLPVKDGTMAVRKQMTFCMVAWDTCYTLLML
jgi:hypothetical protein